MKIQFFAKKFLLFHLFLILTVMLFTSAANAVLLTDGSLDVDIDNNGEFNSISLNAIAIDTSGFVQRYEGNTCSGFSGGTAVNVVGTTATYSAMCGSFDVDVTSSILGPLGSAPGTTSVLEQVLVFTNNTGGSLSLESVSNIDQDLQGAGDDVVAYDGGAQAVFATDIVAAAPDTLLMAAIADTAAAGAIFGWDVDILGSQSTAFPMDNGVGPAGPADTAMSIGFDLGSIPAGQSRTVTFRYLFSTNASSVPPDFGFGPQPPVGPAAVIPTMTEWGMIIFMVFAGLGAIYYLRKQGMSA